MDYEYTISVLQNELIFLKNFKDSMLQKVKLLPTSNEHFISKVDKNIVELKEVISFLKEQTFKCIK